MYTLKYNPRGSIAHYKSRLVVKGFSQVYSADYLEAFAIVVKL